MATRNDRTGLLAPSIAMSVVGLIFLVPFVWLLVTAFKTHGNLTIGGGGPITLKNFQSVLHGELPVRAGQLHVSRGGDDGDHDRRRDRRRLPPLVLPLAGADLVRRPGLAFMASLPIIALMIPTYDFYVSANFINSKFWTGTVPHGHIAPVRHVGRPLVH